MPHRVDTPAGYTPSALAFDQGDFREFYADKFAGLNRVQIEKSSG
jgi:hypothetical protein